MKKTLQQTAKQYLGKWTVPELPETVPGGDMPGDKLRIEAGHCVKAEAIYKHLLKEIAATE